MKGNISKRRTAQAIDEGSYSYSKDEIDLKLSKKANLEALLSKLDFKEGDEALNDGIDGYLDNEPTLYKVTKGGFILFNPYYLIVMKCSYAMIPGVAVKTHVQYKIASHGIYRRYYMDGVRVNSYWTDWETLMFEAVTPPIQCCNEFISALERLEYYGDVGIIPSDESYFTVNETGETITGLSDVGKTQTNIIIPYKINGVIITSIGPYVFRKCYSLKSVIIPDSITYIDQYAFAFSTGLTSVTMSKNVTCIIHDTFHGCTGLKSINIPDGVTSIDIAAFKECNFTSINIPDSVTSIGKAAFHGCTGLKSINIPDSVTSIGVDAFLDCSKITIYCGQGSVACGFAKANNIPVIYTSISAEVIDNVLKTFVATYTTKELVAGITAQVGVRFIYEEAIDSFSITVEDTVVVDKAPINEKARVAAELLKAEKTRFVFYDGDNIVYTAKVLNTLPGKGMLFIEN